MFDLKEQLLKAGLVTENQVQKVQQAAKDESLKFERDAERLRKSAECTEVELSTAKSQLDERIQQFNSLRKRVIDFSERCVLFSAVYNL